jgi:hypothetical protein
MEGQWEMDRVAANECRVREEASWVGFVQDKLVDSTGQ